MTSATAITQPLMQAVTERDLPNPAHIAATELQRYREEAMRKDRQIATLRSRVRDLENDLQDATLEGSRR